MMCMDSVVQCVFHGNACWMESLHPDGRKVEMRCVSCAGSVPLILNFETCHITAQWNVVFDNWFLTVATNVKDMPDFHADKWSKMFGTSTFNSQPDNKVEEPDQQPTQPTR